MARQKAATAVVVGLAGLLFFAGGCTSTAQYLIQQGIGQVSVMLGSVPIDDVLAGGKLDAETERKLRLVVAARDFAHDELGLHVGGSFSYYHETSGQPVAHNLSASRRDELRAKSWTFPIVGQIDYIGYFSRADADAAAADLQNDGYDTFIYGVDAYSTLGWLPDPVHSSFLNRSDGSLVETVIHELAHNTVYAAGQSTFNESLATYVGRYGVRAYYEQHGEEGRQMIETLEAQYADQELITDWMITTEASLRAYYASDASSEEKIAGREAVFQGARDRFTSDVLPLLIDPDRYSGWGNLPTNNAYVLLHRRYHLDLDVIAEVHEQCGEDFGAFLDKLRAAAATDDPFAYLREAAGSP